MPSSTPIPDAAQLWFAVTLACLGLHLFAEFRNWRPLIVVTKLAASTAFLLTALHAGAMATLWGRCLFAGLALSWVGDAALLGRARAAFLTGLVAFLLGHVAYCVAFVIHGVDLGVALRVAPLVIVVAAVVEVWLRPHVERDMRLPVRAYIVVISTMLTLAFAAWSAGASHLLLLGALSFYVSDLAVARDRFVRTDFFNRLWGLPAYYLGQLCLALCVLGLRSV